MNTQRNIRLLSIFNFLTDFDLFAPVAVIYFAKVAGSYTAAMSVFSIFMISAAVFEVPTGILSDKIGRKKTIILGSLASLASALLLALGAHYSYLVASAVMVGLARAFYSGNNDAFLYDTLRDANKEKDYNEYLGKVSSFFQIALAVSALLGSILASISFSVLLWISVVPRLIKLAVSFLFLEPNSFQKTATNIYAHAFDSLRAFFKNPRLRRLSLASIISFSLEENAFQFAPAFINSLWPLWAVGLSRMLSNLGAAMSYYLSGKIVKRFNEKRVLVGGKLYSRILNLVAFGWPTVVSPLLLSLTSISFGTVEVTKNHLMQKEFSDQQRATMSSLNALAGSIGFAVASLAIGLSADRIGVTGTLLSIHLVLFSVVYIYWRLFKRPEYASSF